VVSIKCSKSKQYSLAKVHLYTYMVIPIQNTTSYFHLLWYAIWTGITLDFYLRLSWFKKPEIWDFYFYSRISWFYRGLGENFKCDISCQIWIPDGGLVHSFYLMNCTSLGVQYSYLYTKILSDRGFLESRMEQSIIFFNTLFTWIFKVFYSKTFFYMQ
jgi:hypothetical protein